MQECLVMAVYVLFLLFSLLSSRFSSSTYLWLWLPDQQATHLEAVSVSTHLYHLNIKHLQGSNTALVL